MDSLYGSDNAKYDQHAKHLLSSRKLLAEIVKKVVPEFQDASIDDIAEKYIEGTPLVGSIPEYSATGVPPIRKSGTAFPRKVYRLSAKVYRLFFRL